MDLFVEIENEFQLKNYCRLCANYSEDDNYVQISEYNLFGPTSNSDLIMDVSKFLENSLGIKINEKSLPQQICQTCISVLVHFYQFKLKCLEAEKVLKSIIKDIVPFESKDNLFFEEILFNNPIENDDIAEQSQYSSSVELLSLNPKADTYEILNKVGSDPDNTHNNGFVCLDCRETFEKKSLLQIHRRTCKLVGSEDSKRKGPYTCEKCNKVLPTLVGYSVHKKMHYRQENGIQNKTRVKKQSTSAAKEIDLKVCYICGKTFKQSGALKLHIRFHTKTKPFECNICEKTFYTKSNQKDHMNSHMGEKKFACSTCDKTFSTNRQLRKHVVIHRSRKLQCTMCPKKFIYPYEVQTHMMVHTGYKPHYCTKCDTKFRFSWNLKKHLEKCHRDVDGNKSVIESKSIDMVEFDMVDEPVEKTEETLNTDCDEVIATGNGVIKDGNEIYYEFSI